MFSTKDGDPLALITSGKHAGEFVSISDKGNLGQSFALETGTLIPILSTVGERSVEYIAGPSGSGKSTLVADLVKRYLRLHPDQKAFLFSRSPQEDDPVFAGIPFNQIPITNQLLLKPVDVTKINPGTLLVFDDVGTIHNDAQRKAVEKIMMDAVEVGRKYRIFVIITSHLIIPTDKKFARTIMNEIQYITIFPKSGSAHQINYVLKTYFGMDKTQINRILHLDSRWVRIHSRYPRFVLYDKGAYMV
jgi:hypothetical protein